MKKTLQQLSQEEDVSDIIQEFIISILENNLCVS
jgi:hypothetical protein